MIVYNYKQPCITINNIASVVTETHLWKGLPFAVLAAFLAMFFRMYEDVQDRTWFRWQFMDAVVYKAVAAFASFVIIFRIEAAYRRYRKGCEKAYNMQGDLFDAVSLLIAFCRKSKNGPEVVSDFQHRLVRMLSLMNAFIYADLVGTKPAKELLNFEVIDCDGLDIEGLKILSSTKERLQMVFQWIQALVVDHMDSGTLNIPPPILTRFHEESANAIVTIQECLNLTEVPFPFPLAVTAEILLFIYSGMTAVMMVEWTKYLATAALFTYLLVSVVWFFNGIAAALENPFELQKHSLNTPEMQHEFNEHLLTLMNPSTQEVPKLTAEAIMNPTALYQMNEKDNMKSLRGSLSLGGSVQLGRASNASRPSSHRSSNTSHV
mmetsp:Transcript_63752/g.151981  ORF Transcript_63752/g.151981 Transcript_63752/m.151981 type:complete len:378 (+) Transcript_63752:122-1255(+)